MEALLRLAGPLWAERVTVASAVLLYWGAFYLIHRATGSRPWFLTPYSRDAHVRAGFSSRIPELLRIHGIQPLHTRAAVAADAVRFLLALPLAALALLAHALPFAWAIFSMAFLYLARKIKANWRWLLLPGGIALLVAVRTILVTLFPHQHPSTTLNVYGIAGLTGVEQVWLYGAQYLIVCLGLLIVFAVLVLERTRGRSGAFRSRGAALDPASRRVRAASFRDPVPAIPARAGLHSAAHLVPVSRLRVHSGGQPEPRPMDPTSWSLWPRYSLRFCISTTEHSTTSEMKSLRSWKHFRRASASWLYSRTRYWIESSAHVIDRACIGHCFSYANYEPATAQFRVRVRARVQLSRIQWLQ